MAINGVGLNVGPTQFNRETMFVKDAQDQTLIKVLDVTDLIDPQNNQIQGQQQAGEEEQPPQAYEKSRLQFPSGEALPECWTNPDYKLQQSPTPQA